MVAPVYWYHWGRYCVLWRTLWQAPDIIVHLCCALSSLCVQLVFANKSSVEHFSRLLCSLLLKDNITLHLSEWRGGIFQESTLKKSFEIATVVTTQLVHDSAFFS